MRTSRSAVTPGNSICSAITATATISGNASGPTTGPGQQWTVGCVTLCDPFKVLSPSPGIRVHPCPRKPGKPTHRDHPTTWNLVGDRGARVTVGIYFVRLRAGPIAATRRLVVPE